MSPIALVIVIFLISLLFGIIQVGIISITFDKLGLSQNTAFMIIILSILGSFVNIPLFKIKAEAPENLQIPFFLRGMLKLPQLTFKGYTVIAVNFGGCLIPITVSLYLMTVHDIPTTTLGLAIGLMSTVSYFASRPIHGLGVGMPIFIAPLFAAAIALLIAPEQSAPLAYIAGTLGVIIGADLLRLKDIRKMGTPMASIGGAGTFDGIFITGIVAALLA